MELGDILDYGAAPLQYRITAINGEDVELTDRFGNRMKITRTEIEHDLKLGKCLIRYGQD